MTFNKKMTTVAMSAGFLASTVTLAQTESFPPPPPPVMEEMYAPPPEVVPSAGFSNPTATPPPPVVETRIVAPAKNKNGVLTDSQRAKFAKATPEDITAENFPETIESFDFPNVDITDIVKAISELTGKNFIIDSTVRGKITIVAPSKITVAEAYKAFLSSLAINGFTVVPSGGFLKIRNARSAQRDNIDTYSGSYYPNTDQMITKIVHLKHITAEAIQQQLRLLTSSYGEMAPFSSTNSLIISDFGANIDRIMKILNQLDVPGFEEQLEVIGVKYARAKDIAELIDKVINKGEKRPTTGAGGFSSGVPRFSSAANRTTGGQQGASYFMVFPEDRTNSLIVVGNRAGINRVKKLITQLDFKVKAEDQGGVYVYYVKNGDAEKIAQTLQEVAKDSGPKSAAPAGGAGGAASILAPQGQAAIREGLFGGDVQIKADKNTNSLVISASKQDYEKVLSILQKLDIPRDQVFVEGIIMEMALNDGFEQSAGFIKFNEGGGKAGFTSSSSGAADFLNPLSGGSAILGFASSNKVSIPNFLDSTKPPIQVPDIVGYINLLKSFGKTNILSTPQILAMDNQDAEIEVGDQVITGATFTPGQNGAAGQTTPIFGEAKITLKIKPIISPNSESVRMEVQQTAGQISTLTVPKNFEGLAQPLSSRKIKTTIIVQNGDTAVLGGLIKDEELETVKKVPLLGDLPVLGWLFKGKKSDKKKVNMLVFLTPKIIRNPADQRNLLTNKTNERLRFIKQQGGKDPFGATVDKVLKRETRAPQSIPVKE
ncbi:MAG: type II secretion system protein GspD [Bdellovibrionales bacterium RIFCSPHIGHO2_01_FULL_40_29]|nr:MAG: type II secretion system protein GspD [Bdellovibrionales bacterium RIFCSPHIGHO2_01_FULL_40_29]OFZ34537.1 MAG: type II secretion system protein GspD [Bdellovibrionales bacterium RIFCSPHIGHO2_02_FULL_40_15]